MRERRTKVSRLSELNDPFEMFAVDLSRSWHRGALADTFRSLDTIAGFMCFSRTWTNPVIWAHYAGRHRGMSLGFDIPDEFATTITYTGAREPFPNLEGLPQVERFAFMMRLLYSKFDGWSYEDEVRVSVRLDWTTLTSGMFFPRVGTALHGYPEVRFLKAAPADDTFTIVNHFDDVWNHDDLVYCRIIDGTIHPVRFVR
ncbi:MAG TPA: hypothetical protein VFA27_09830 [Vicinamibacterales bacterium]|nr:hypothetical protein [Vicinamibacterales bacterium]